MDVAVDHQHRTGLGGEARGGRVGEIARGLLDAGDAVADPEHAIGQKMEIGRAGAGVGAHAPLAVLDIEADRRKIVAEHAGVHREAQRPPARRQRLRKRGEIAIGLALGVGPIEADVVTAHVEAADRVARRIEVARRAGRRGPRRRARRAATQSASAPKAASNPMAVDRRVAPRARISASWRANRRNSSAEP